MKKYQYHDVNFRGTIEQVFYTTTNREGKTRKKYANVYLPYGYNAADAAKKYNILYLIHGGGGNPDAWLDCCKIKNMLDYSIDAKEAESLIVVFPTFYKEQVPRVGAPDAEAENIHTLFFQKELTDELLPAVESKYNVYAKTTTADALKSARAHRAIGGFSMGSCTTWYAFMKHLAYFTDFVPLSGDCWAVECRGGGTQPQTTAQALEDAAKDEGFTADDYRIFAAIGTADPAYQSLGPQIEAMKKHTKAFDFSEDYSEGNFHFLLGDNMVHSYEDVYHYLYNYLPELFKNI